MTLTFDPQTYSSLLSDTLPQAIETEAEYDRLLVLTEELMAKKQARTPEEEALYKLLFILIEAYEQQEYPMPTSNPHQVLQHIMEVSGTSMTDLETWLSCADVEPILAGRQSLTIQQAEVLADRFKVEPDLFL
jgi:HTH-type transcriptional regulator / antitoxin HigA